jgi:cytochrome P450
MVEVVMQHVATAHRPIPLAPGRLPGIGHALLLLNRPLAFLRSLPKIAPLVQVNIGSLPMIVVTNAALTQLVLTDSKTFDKGGALYDKVVPLTGESLLTSKHDMHRRQRRLMQPAFSQARIKLYANVMRDVIDGVLGSWANGSVVDMTEATYQITSQSAARTMFASPLAGEPVNRLVEALGIYLHGLFLRMMDPTGLYEHIPLPANLQYNRAVALLHESVDEIINGYKKSSVDHGDLLSMLLAGEDEHGEKLTHEEVHNQVITLFLAGIETTGGTLGWSIYFLGENPHIARRLRDETDRVLAGRPAQWEDVPQLAETRRVITESLRMYPPGWLFTREVMCDTELGGYHLPKGTGVAYSPYLLHRNPEAFTDPDSFDPDRWLSGRVESIPKGAFVPFGGGTHKCIGDQFGLTEVTLALANLAANWDFVPEFEGSVEPAPRRATLTPTKLPMRVSRRS